MGTETNPNIKPLDTITAEQLLSTKFEPLRPVISRILPCGTFVYAGASKIGKSWMVLWLANQIALGLPVWDFETTKCEVLYLSLEDTGRRLQQRLNEIADEVGKVHFATKAGLLGNGLEEQLVGFIQKYPAAKLIIIDTLEKVRNSQKDKHGYSEDYDVVGKIKEIGDTYDVTFLIVHHTRKEGDNDAVNTISGTNGIAGSADGIFILQKENRLQNRANLLVVGRDVQTITLSLEFDPESCKWSLLSHSDSDVTTATDPVLVAVSKLINESCPHWEGTPSELLAQLKKISPEIDVKANVLTRRLNSNSDLLLTKFWLNAFRAVPTRNGSSPCVLSRTMCTIKPIFRRPPPLPQIQTIPYISYTLIRLKSLSRFRFRLFFTQGNRKTQGLKTHPKGVASVLSVRRLRHLVDSFLPRQVDKQQERLHP